MEIDEFNRLAEAEAAALLRACVGIDAWVEHLLAGRPWGDAAALREAAATHASTWTPAQVGAALADHPRIGERPAPQLDAEAAAHSRREQAGVDPADADLARRLADGNARYEERFDRIYLVRAKGRTGEQMLALLEERLANDPVTEQEVTRGQLAEIALLRLDDLLAAGSTSTPAPAEGAAR